MVLNPLASSLAVLNQEEKEVGSLLIEMGSGTTDFILYHNEHVVHSGVIPYGGEQVIRDIAVGLNSTRKEAARAFHENGAALYEKVGKDEVFSVPGINGKSDRLIEKRLLAWIIEERMREIFEMVKKELENSKQDNPFGAGIVITGGCGLVPHVDLLVTEVFNVSARVGSPLGLGGAEGFADSPAFATAVGIIKYVLADTGEWSSSQENDPITGPKNDFTQKIAAAIKKFF